MSELLSQYFFYYFTLSSLIRFVLVIICSNQTPLKSCERNVRHIVNTGIIIDLLHLIAIVLSSSLLSKTVISDFLYFNIDFKIIWTLSSICYLCFAIGLIAVVSRFSCFYLHRDNFFYKFFALIYILELSIVLLVLTVTTETVFIGWELLGITSVLLIAFYENKAQVLKNSLTILVIYKISDVIFYSAIIYAAYQGYHTYIEINNSYTIFLILLACVIKSSLFPWIWLPRAMEGPTPSSAIFYGGIATHIPMFLFYNLWIHSPNNDPNLIYISTFLILISSIASSFMSRVSPDAKTAIAYSSITQLGIIYIEILWGFYTLALVHGIVNGVYRSIEFLKSPSLLYNRHLIEMSRHKLIDSSGVHLERIIPVSIREYMYKLAYHEFIIPRWFITTIQRFLGLHSSRANKTAIKHYIYVSFFLFLILELTIYNSLKIGLTVLDETVLLAAFVLNVIAIIYKYNPVKFFTALLASTMAIFTLLIDHANISFTIPSWCFIILIIYFIFDIYFKNGSNASNLINYSGRIYTSRMINAIVLFIGISIIGVPGLVSFIIWENLEHLIVATYPNLIMYGFFIMALNTIAFFRFYYANFLGYKFSKETYDTVKQY